MAFPVPLRTWQIFDLDGCVCFSLPFLVRNVAQLSTKPVALGVLLPGSAESSFDKVRVSPLALSATSTVSYVFCFGAGLFVCRRPAPLFILPSIPLLSHVKTGATGVCLGEKVESWPCQLGFLVVFFFVALFFIGNSVSRAAMATIFLVILYTSAVRL